MSIISKLDYRIRLKLNDINAVVYSKYVMLETINETLSELKNTVTQFYDRLSFMIPGQSNSTINNLDLIDGGSFVNFEVPELTETDDTGWPVEFDRLIIEYASILLLPGSYESKENAKILWKQKALAVARSFNTGTDLMQGSFGPTTVLVKS